MSERIGRDSEPLVCGLCDGRGWVVFFAGEEIPCWNCDGTGEAPGYQTIGIKTCVHGVSFTEDCEACEAEDPRNRPARVIFEGEASDGRRFEGR